MKLKLVHQNQCLYPHQMFYSDIKNTCLLDIRLDSGILSWWILESETSFLKIASLVSSQSQSPSKVFDVYVALVKGSSAVWALSFLIYFNTPTTILFLFFSIFASVMSFITTPEDFDYVFNFFDFLTTISGTYMYLTTSLATFLAKIGNYFS